MPFTSGADAVEALARDAPFDVVVTDLEMPRVDGRAVVSSTREHHPGACLVVASAKAADHATALGEAGVCIVADKPLDYDLLTTRIAECRARAGHGLGGRCHLRSHAGGAHLLTLHRK